ncbi:MAG: signal peptidase I [Solirubrobacterales bacterium]
MTEPDPRSGASDPETTPRAEVATTAAAPADVTTTPSDTPSPRSDERRQWRFVGSLPFLIIVALCAAILIKSFLVQAFFIPSESMEPTLMKGDRVLVNKLAYAGGDVGRQDVVVFVNPNGDAPPDRGLVGGFLHWLGEGIGVAQPENEDYIKRVIGLPGETLEIRDEEVLIDGTALDEPYLTAEAKTCNREFGPVTVPAGSLFVMGDNRCNSADSRYGLGFVPEDKVVGRAFVIIWPPSNVGGLG